jgi:predicted TIM-barrel fold metal-dependent hydrolase
MAELDFRAFDADNHYYEAEDAFTRHIDPKMAKRAMQWAEVDGKKRLLVGGKVNKFIPNPTFDPVARPGSLEDYFRGRNTEGLDLKTMFGELDPLAERPEVRNRDARLAHMDEQGLEGIVLYPTLAVGMQEALKKDVGALHAAFAAFNRWLEDDWGYRYEERIFAAPLITMADPAAAAVEVERVLGAGARILCMTPGPVPTGRGYQSPGLPDYDPVWSLVAEAGVPVAFHAGLSATSQYGKYWEPPQGGQFEGFKHHAFPMVAFIDRAVSETFAALICHGLFERFPTLRVATIENGAMWVPDLLRNLEGGYGKMPFAFERHPVEQFLEHVWVAPYYEDDMDMLKDTVGIDHLLFGSDYPHAEGLPDPTDFVDDIPTYDADETRKIMRDNIMGLLGL